MLLRRFSDVFRRKKHLLTSHVLELYGIIQLDRLQLSDVIVGCVAQGPRQDLPMAVRCYQFNTLLLLQKIGSLKGAKKRINIFWVCDSVTGDGTGESQANIRFHLTTLVDSPWSFQCILQSRDILPVSRDRKATPYLKPADSHSPKT